MCCITYLVNHNEEDSELRHQLHKDFLAAIWAIWSRYEMVVIEIVRWKVAIEIEHREANTMAIRENRVACILNLKKGAHAQPGLI